MQLNKINGNTYFINAPTNIGVYVYKNKNCMLVDTGLNSSQARKLDEILKANNLHPKYIINTHSHLDHCGANMYFQETYPGCIVYASELERVYMENPNLQPTILFSSNPVKELGRNNKPLKIDYSIYPGINKINDEKFRIVSLSGHSIGQIGIETSDRVCFLGDSVFSSEILDKYSLPYLYDIEGSIKTLNNMKEIDADYFLISHIDRTIDRNELLELISSNINTIEYYKNMIFELLEQPLTREDLLENLVVLNDLRLSFKQYHLYFSSVSAFITYLYDLNLIEYSIENGKIYYFQK